MAKHEEQLVVNTCPVCGQEHTFSLDAKPVKVSQVWMRSVAHRDNARSKATALNLPITRFCVCPVKNESFQVTYEVT